MSFTRPRGLNHAAYLTRDTAKTVTFYTEVLGMRLVGHALDDKVGSTGEAQRFLHTFFEMADGSCIAFFDLEGLADDADQSIVPRWVRHIAFNVGSMEELEDADISPGTIRVSAGLEHVDDLLDDFRQALDIAGA